MTGEGLPTSRSLSLTHCLLVSTATHDERPRLTGAHVHGARWVEAAHTELGELGELSSMLGEASRPGFAGANRGTIGTAETSLMLAIDEDEPDTTRARRTPVPALVVAVPAVRPQAPIFGQTESTGPMTPKRPLRAEVPSTKPGVVSTPQRTSAPPPAMAVRAHTAPAPRAKDTPAPAVDAAAVRAVLAQPTALLLPAEPMPSPSPSSRPLAPLARPRAKSFVAPASARPLSFVSRLGVPVVPPPAMDTAPMGRLVVSSARVVVVSQSPQQRALNMAAAILSGLAAAMAVMAVAISV
jgi:hypothetical protein